MRCRNCRYSLANLTGRRCPECGNPFDPDDPNTFDGPAGKKARWIRLLVIAGLTYLALFAWSAHDALTQAPPQVVNNVPGVRIASVPPPVSTSMLRAALLALTRWPLAALFVFLGSVCASVLIQKIRIAVSAFQR